MTPEYLLAHLRAARARARLAALEIDSIGVALKSNLIGTDEALAWLADVDALRFLLEPECHDTGANVSSTTHLTDTGSIAA